MTYLDPQRFAYPSVLPLTATATVPAFTWPQVPAVFSFYQPAGARPRADAHAAARPTAKISVSARAAERIATNNPYLLAEWLQQGLLSDWGAAIVCDVLGRNCSNATLVAAALRPALEHSKAYVRESAVLGLRNHIDNEAVQHLLHEAMQTEQTEEVKAAILSALRMV